MELNFGAKKLNKSFYGILVYTWVRSEFKDKMTIMCQPWDNQHMLV